MLRRQADFRLAADAIAEDFAEFPEVRAITLFGSVARPLVREVPRFWQFKRHAIEILHECGDLDLAVAVDRLDNLAVSIAPAAGRSSISTSRAASALPITRSMFSCSAKAGMTISAGYALSGNVRRARESVLRRDVDASRS